MKSIRWMSLAALAMGVCLAGCSLPGSGQPCWTTGGGDSASPAGLEGFVTDCDISPKDTYMVDLSTFLREDQDLRNKDRGQTLAALRDWRKNTGDDLGFLLRNPSSPDPIKDYSHVRLVYVFAEHRAVAVCEDVHAAVLVDFAANTLRSSNDPATLLSDPTSGTQTGLADDTRGQLISLLSSDIGSWTLPDGETAPPDWIDSPSTSWEVVICADDYSVHRFTSPVSGKAPPGLDDFLKQFQAILGVDGLAVVDQG